MLEVQLKAAILVALDDGPLPSIELPSHAAKSAKQRAVRESATGIDCPLFRAEAKVIDWQWSSNGVDGGRSHEFLEQLHFRPIRPLQMPK